ncbi:hypothetical protein POTOM_010034 [Populus tomentosa]|uniref:Uncharacterized protein n=1 Tax=Populus tomentosa TaxID=118781 RepID=A0A8X8A7T3_POPTO|nr:hypothetical protein POTOM_010034 [Populus tomentosa]
MVDPWWSLLGAAIPAIIAGQALRMKKRRADEQRLKSARGREKSSDEIFVCERVCTSKRMLKKVGALSKDPTIDTCVTVCGVSELDACADACARTVCVNQHQVPNWNDICLRRCQSSVYACLLDASSNESGTEHEIWRPGWFSLPPVLIVPIANVQKSSKDFA